MSTTAIIGIITGVTALVIAVTGLVAALRAHGKINTIADVLNQQNDAQSTTPPAH